jgi:hypothetical protein
MRNRKLMLGLGIAGGGLMLLGAAFGIFLAYNCRSLNKVTFDMDSDNL